LTKEINRVSSIFRFYSNKQTHVIPLVSMRFLRLRGGDSFYRLSVKMVQYGCSSQQIQILADPIVIDSLTVQESLCFFN
ncbi:hypothetical protein LCGC14_1751400, partial [marine sediment metagenome]